MTVTDHDRIIKLEAEQGMLVKQVGELRADFALQIVSIRNHHTEEFAKINAKLDDIADKMSQGKGIWWALKKVGTWVGILFATAITVWTAFFK